MEHMDAPGVEDAFDAALDPEEQGEVPAEENPLRFVNQSEVVVPQDKKVCIGDHHMAQRRLMQDLRALRKTVDSDHGADLGISAHPVEDNLFRWKAVVAGPVDTDWEGGLFKLDLSFNDEYPVVPPHVKFVTKNIFHPNVYVDGNICLDTLKSCWSPSLDVEALLLSIRSLLSDPNPRSAANGAAAMLHVKDPAAYAARVRKLVEDSLEQSFSDMDEEEEEEDGKAA
ncbi:ubiquitin-conjugating enzyme E2 B [Strigomonas culicis]|uniref:Ubiquitin-conjugating enzyme E2 B n=1 Tax=Strigomonas culicis TaxID=28005 RepID=S9V1G1_9TRYP|nr:ubiquitin-conjugating enzyme E2 B [Strigomonas culicis]|eukprot:EPY16605.1 ubiquitin-conjugating enzyme E2 B [Strigomonas culicis]